MSTRGKIALAKILGTYVEPAPLPPRMTSKYAMSVPPSQRGLVALAKMGIITPPGIADDDLTQYVLACLAPYAR